MLTGLLVSSIFAFVPAANGVPAPRCVAVAATSDFHGALAPDVAGEGTSEVAAGGVAGLSAYIGRLRDDFAGRLVLVDAGDLFVGTLAAKASAGAVVIDAFNLLGYDAAAVGNHEFDYGQPALAARLRQANFPLLAANIDSLAADGSAHPWQGVRPSTMFERGGVRIGVVGAATPWTAQTSQPGQIAGLRFVPPVARVAREAQALRRAGAELVILLAHVGGSCHRFDDPFDLAGSCESVAASELFTLVAGLPAGAVDIALGGHSHTLVAHWLGDTAVMQAGSRGQHLTYLEACVGAAGGIDRGASRIHPPQATCLTSWADGRCRGTPGPAAVARPATFRGAPLRVDPRVEATLRPYLERTLALARAPADITLPGTLAPQALCRLAADGMRRQSGADFALQNSGGLRRPMGPGPLDHGTLFEAMPFDNPLVVARLTGAQLQQLADDMHSGGTHSQPVFCASGLDVDADGRLRLAPAERGGGGPLVADKTYTLATNAFISQGGEGAAALFASLPPGAVSPAREGVAEALAGELRRRFPAPGLPRAPAQD